MKKKFLSLTAFGFLLIGLNCFAQGPPSPPVDPSAGGGPVGGSAPLGEGIAVMLGAASCWAGKKIIRYYRQEHKQQLEE